MANPVLARVGWCTFVALTVTALVGLLGQAVDPENRALKLPDGPEARRFVELAKVVPGDPVVLVGCLPSLSSALGADERAAIQELVLRLAAVPGVREVDVVEPPESGVVLLPVSLSVDAANVDRTPYAIAQHVADVAGEKAIAGVDIATTGLPLIEGTIAKLVAGERSTIVPLLLGVLLCAAWIGYRRLTLAIGVLLPAVLAIAWTGGSIAWLGHELDPVAALLDPVLLTIGVAASVHFVEAFQRHRIAANSSSVARAVEAAREHLRRPAFWATTTTMLGLWSLTVNETPAVVDFGVRAALGVALTHLFTFVVLPAWLRWRVSDLPIAVSGSSATRAANGAPRRLGAIWVACLLRMRFMTLGVAVAAAVVAGLGLRGLQTENDPLTMLAPGNPARRAHDRLAKRLGGVELFHLLIESDSPATEASRLLPFVAAAVAGDEIAGPGGPVLRGIEGQLAVPMLLRPGGSTARAKQFDVIDQRAEALGLRGVACAGPSVQIARDSVTLMHGLLGSLVLSLLVLSVVMAIGLGSVRLALAAMLPNLMPSLLLYGGLGLVGRPLSVATAMIGCVMLGLIVDNTLHLLHHYREARRSMPTRAAVESALDRCGRAISLSTTMLMLGFATAATSSLSTTVEFGVLATATIAMAWFGTAVLLPTLLLALVSPRGTGPGRLDAGADATHAGEVSYAD